MEDSFPETVALPELIYKIGEEPFNPSLKINKFYNKKNVVNNLEDIVGPVLFERLRASFLGPILKTINRNLELSGKLLHYILTRNLVTKKHNELWFNFGGQPMRFSIREFHMVTGLKCSGDVTVGSNNGVMKWRDLETKKHTLDQLLQKLRSLESDALEDKYCLAMLFVIESLFMTTYTGCYYDIDSVKIAKDADKLNNYPWGRKAYKILLESVKFNIKSSLQKETYSIAGFPLALHLWIVQSIPVFQSSFSHIDKQCSGFICERFLQLDSPSLEPIRNLQTDTVEVTMILPSLGNDIEDSIILEDEEDIILQGMTDLVRQGYRIKMGDWHRGYVDYVQAVDIIATQKCMPDKEKKKEENNVNNVSLEMIFNFIKQQFASMAERIAKIEEQMKIYNENLVDRNGHPLKSVFSSAERNQDQNNRECGEKDSETEAEQNESKSYQDDVDNCFDDVEHGTRSSFNHTQETVKLNLNSMDYLGSNNSKLSKTLEINLDNDSVNPNTTPEDIAELKNNEFGESVEATDSNLVEATNDQSHQSEQQQQKEVNQGNDGVETTKQTEPNLTSIIAEIQQYYVWRTPEGNNDSIESNHPIEENQTQMTEDYVHPATVFPLPSFSFNISPIQTQDTKKMKRQLDDTVDDSKRRKISDSEEPSSQGVPETLAVKDKQLSVAVKDIMFKLRRTERDFKPINYNITPFRAPPNPATSVKPEKHSVYHPFLAPDAEKMKIWNQWMHDKNPSPFKVGSYNLGPQWFKFIVDPHQTLYEEHVDAIFEMLRVRRETDPVYFHNNRLPKAAFLKTKFLKKMKNDHYNAEFLKFPAVYEWTDDIVDNAISEQWMEKVDVLYGVVRRNKRWFGMCINIKMHTFTVFNGQDEEVGSSFPETDIKPFAELFSSFLFAIGKDKKYAPFILKSVDRKHCPKRKVATNNGFSVIKQIECHCMGIEDVSELIDTNEVDLRRKMASDIYYHFQYE